MSAISTFPVEVIRDIERKLSEPLFRGVPIGATLNDFLIIELYVGRGNWDFVSRWKNRLRRLKYFLRPVRGREAMPTMPQGRILVTWMYDKFHINGLVQPVLKALESEEPLVLCGTSDMRCKTPNPAGAISWKQVMHYDVAAWRSDYRKCRGPWQERLRELCRKHRLPRGAYDRLAFQLLLSSQYVAGYLEFLQTLRPSAILTEYDRHAIWSSLVLSARRLGIPTFTMVHGVPDHSMFGYVPVLADRVFCWGQLGRECFLAAGEAPDRLLIGGCPRLTRELSATPAESRRKLGLDVGRPAVMLATAPYRRDACLVFAKCFCEAAQRSDAYSAFVRLHPSEQLDFYADLIRRYPKVRFTSNTDATLDEALAASNIVVVHHSGVGSDALVKGRLTIVLDVGDLPLSYGLELIERAGCPRAADVNELGIAIDRLLFNDKEREKHLAMAKEYVDRFCAAFGQDSARRIGDLIRKERLARRMATTGKRESI